MAQNVWWKSLIKQNSTRGNNKRNSEIKALKKEIKALKEAYAEMTIEKKVYETYLQVYGEETGRSEEIKKN